MNITVLNNTGVIKIGLLRKGLKQANTNQRNDENDKLRSKLEKQIVAAEWLRVIAQVLETTSTEQLFALDEAPNSQAEFEGKNEILSGLLIGTIGQFASAIGVTKELFATDPNRIINIHKNLLLADNIQLFGSILEILGSAKVIDDEIQDAADMTFIPPE
ncbi:hypothetical protein [Gottfriedia solisilvae]|uniref:Uncharacterized protein n=1 Tax=Gottfriedia solisilvae TaxID=1516104 RepID=A0A8J3F1S7_9BACI|nr:hypothetical protein [Gottfriedia solisilvae]GGI17269.1 hypothetical protein GCM10007380_37100 [Gottfriedia solisilvae]